MSQEENSIDICAVDNDDCNDELMIFSPAEKCAIDIVNTMISQRNSFDNCCWEEENNDEEICVDYITKLEHL